MKDDDNFLSGASSDSTISIKEMAGRLRVAENEGMRLAFMHVGLFKEAADMLERLAVDREELDQQRRER